MPSTYKPKLSAEQKLQKAAALLNRLNIQDVIVPTSMILLERYKMKKTPAGPFEQHVFHKLNEWQQEADIEQMPGPVARMGPALDLYKSADANLKKLFFPAPLINWDLNKPIEDWALFASTWITEGAAQVASFLYDEPSPAPQPGKVRPWLGEIMDPDIRKQYVAPWPWINAINGVRVRNHIPRLTDYADNEYEATATYTAFNPDTNEVQVSLTANQGSCSIPGNKAPNGICLKVAETRLGETVEIIGFNFFSKSCRVRIASTAPNGWKGEVEAKVHGDAVTQADIVDGRVQDRLTFEIPPDLPQNLVGDYSITVLVPNDISYTFSGETVSNPAYENSTNTFLSNIAYLRVRPSGNEQYNIYLWKGKCYRETDGEWGSDEIAISAFPVMFTAGQNQPTKFPEATSTIWGDVDNGETKVDWGWNPMGISFNSPFGIKNSILAIGLVGYEIDSEDAFKEQIKSFGDAYFKYLKIIWSAIQAGGDASAGGFKASDAVMSLAKYLGVGVSLLIGGIAVAAILAVGLIYAAWAPADMILKDVILVDETTMYNMTQPHSVMPRPTFRSIRLDDDFSATITPIYTDNFVFTEERRYKSTQQGSDYGFVFRYQRLI